MTSPAAPILAYTPFIDPINAHSWWFLLLIPLAALTAIAYKSVRTPDMAQYARQTTFFALQILIGIAGLYTAALIFIRHVLPLIV